MNACWNNLVGGRVIPRWVRIWMVLVVAWMPVALRGQVLCVGDERHIEIETMMGGNECCPAPRCEEHISTCWNEDDGCGECRDVGFSAGVNPVAGGVCLKPSGWSFLEVGLERRGVGERSGDSVARGMRGLRTVILVN